MSEVDLMMYKTAGASQHIRSHHGGLVLTKMLAPSSPMRRLEIGLEYRSTFSCMVWK